MDERFEVLDLPLDRVGLRITALITPSPVVMEHREMLCEECRQLRRRRVDRSILKGSAHQHDRWALARPVERDDRAVIGHDLVHIKTSRRLCSGSGWIRCPIRPLWTVAVGCCEVRESLFSVMMIDPFFAVLSLHHHFMLKRNSPALPKSPHSRMSQL